MNHHPQLFALQRTASDLARQLTAFQLLCHSRTYAQHLPELVAQILSPITLQLDELEVISAFTPLNGLLEQANRYTTDLMTLLANCSNTLTPAELAPMLNPTVRLLTEVEGKAMGVSA
ncbi:hypothetical protein [Aeromonas salmonicida]